MYQVYLTSRARKQLKRIDTQYHVRIKELLISLQSNPIPHKTYDIVKMEGKIDTYRIRIGDVRIIYEINLHDKEINVLAIMSRSSAYKKSK